MGRKKREQVDLEKRERMQGVGIDLINIASEKVDTENKRRIVEEVADIMRKISECQRTIEMAQAGLRHFTAQRNALELGEFHFHPWSRKLRFNDPALNESYQKGFDGFISTRLP